MILTFEPVQTIGAGSNPMGVHLPDNIFQAIYVGTDGSIFARGTPTDLGVWTERVFDPAIKICNDVDVEYLKAKHIANAIFVCWKNNAEPGEVVPYQQGVTHTLRHRFAVWYIRRDISNYLIDGSVEFGYDDPIARVSISFENPSYILSHEEQSAIPPGTALLLLFRAGDSARYPMGRYFVDTNDMTVGDSTTSIEGRNYMGKLLRDQTFDTDNNYPLQNLRTLALDILDKASVVNYWVGSTSLERGMKFPSDMNIMDGFKELINTALNWQIRESMSGEICFGEKTDPYFPVASTYEFERDNDIFSRGVTRDDQDVYSRVCVHDDDYTIAVYRDVTFKFVLGRKKTLHVSIAKESSSDDAIVYAETIAALLSNVGVTENFTGPFRPYLQPGDNAKIIGRNTRMLGMITTVRHSFGKSGFTTDFTVDSGSTANKTRVSDYINKITGQSTGGNATRLYS